MSPTLPGFILKSQSGFFTVRTAQGDYVCRLRGRLKRRQARTDLAVVGDRVQIEPLPDGTGMIAEVAPRERALSRRAPGERGRRGRPTQDETEQVIVANPDQVVLVFACAEPEPRLRMLDRFLVSTEARNIPALICANKVDLVARDRADELFGLYTRIGYRVLFTSAVTGAGLDELRAALSGKLSVLTGPSGVGKTSLLNALQPGLGRLAREVSRATSKGRHTTVHVELLPLETGGYVADTPGLRSLLLWDIEPEEIDGYFPDIKPHVAQCEFSNCTHSHEPGCAVRRAVEAGLIAPSRYESYCRMRAGQH